MSQKKESIQNIISRTEGGILKRLDENRELLELLEREAAELFRGLEVG